MLKPALAFAAVALLTSSALAETCKSSDRWSYSDDHGTGPNCWAEVDPKNKACIAGKSQSPIDLKESEMSPQSDTTAESAGYAPVPLKVINNGHTVQIEIPEGQTYSARQYEWSDGSFKKDAAPSVTKFRLAQIHFHTPSEHTIGGEEYPLEAHMVHLGPNGQKLVRGVLFREGHTPHPFLTQLLAVELPEAKGKTVTADDKTIDPNALYADAGRHFEYLGSLTTPNCEEGVTWRVSAEVAVATKEQIDAVRNAIGMENARPVQALNGRDVYFWTAKD